jgi:hypothetical protein
MIDITAAYALEDVRAELESRGIDFIIARSRTALREQLTRYGVLGINPDRFYPSIKAAVLALQGRDAST